MTHYVAVIKDVKKNSLFAVYLGKEKKDLPNSVHISLGDTQEKASELAGHYISEKMKAGEADAGTDISALINNG